MNRTVVGHQGMEVMSPISNTTMARLVSAIEPMSRLLEVGCGKAALLRQALKKNQEMSAVAIELSAAIAAEAALLAKRQGLSSRIQWVVGAAGEWQSGGDFDALVCLGSTQACGGLQKFLSFANQHLRRGVLVVGEPVWVAEPSEEYLTFLGTPRASTHSLLEVEPLLADAGFVVRETHLSTLEDWDTYEQAYFNNLRKFTDIKGEHPFAEFANTFEEMQRRQGRACLGFVSVVAQQI